MGSHRGSGLADGSIKALVNGLGIEVKDRFQKLTVNG